MDEVLEEASGVGLFGLFGCGHDYRLWLGEKRIEIQETCRCERMSAFRMTHISIRALLRFAGEGAPFHSFSTGVIQARSSVPTSGCKGGTDATDETDDAGVIGDGTRPAIERAEYACFEDTNGGKFFYLRIEANDEQGADTIDINGALVLFKDATGPLDWDEDGTGDPDVYLDLTCEAGTDPRRCEGSLLETSISGACDGTKLILEGWAVDADDNAPDHVEGFELNASIAPTG